MWIVRLALRRPYTIAVMALLILVLGALSLSRMVVDIFPTIDIPVVVVVSEGDGKVVRLSSGLEEGELVILSPGFGILEGERVEPVRVFTK